MCGIAGISLQAGGTILPSELQRMCDIMQHRGPDDEGTFVAEKIGLGMRRLSIIDLSSGHQPIHNEDRSIWVVLNGEIYNFRALRKELEERGHRFYTNSDTEVLVHLYEQYGDQCVEHLVGMYCFALWDSTRQRLFIARDRVGEKQLFYALKNGKFAFGSEIKCLLQTDVVSRDMNLAALDSYLTYLYVPAPATFFRDVCELPPAHFLVFDRNGLRLQRYWDLSFRVDRHTDQHLLVEMFRERFGDAVRERLISDVPLGALLSGGIDSSAIVAAMSEYSTGPVRTFSIGYEGDGSYYDERQYAREVARRFSTEHNEIVIKPQIVDVVPKLVEAFDQPFADSSAIANYYVFRETRKHVKVVLSGLGGDEVAAGYERYVGLELQKYYRTLPRWLREGVIDRAVGGLPDSRRGARLVERAKRFVRTGSMPSNAAYYQLVTAFQDEPRRDLYEHRLLGELDASLPRRLFDAAFDQPDLPDTLSRALYSDTVMYLPGDLLTLTDRMSMQHSIEARAPFVDHKLMEFMACVPAEVKLKRFRKKHLLKQAFKNILPPTVLHRPKQGFTVPLTVWLRQELRPLIEDMLSEERIRRSGLFRWSSVRRMLEEHMEYKQNHHSRIWALLMFMVWKDLYNPRLP